jgi:N-methylhydantoinase B/oxoprolinase/acetone carboxylase alpha subunit
VGRGGCSFSDDLALFGGTRLAVRVQITDLDHGWLVDLRDCAEPSGTPRFRLGQAQAHVAVAIAIGHALGQAGPVDPRAVELLTDPDTWVGGHEPEDPVVAAFGMARLFDAVVGALANAWPGTVGAGSCTLGAVVGIGRATPSMIEVLPGGEGATPTRPGRDAWSGPILPAAYLASPPEWLRATSEARDGSGGVGARAGGRGLVRRYTVQAPAEAFVAIDRVDNPPHGIDRAGPPTGSRLRIELPGGGAVAVRPWSRFELPPRSTLVVETCGGAGHGFPGWGDIDWDG